MQRRDSDEASSWACVCGRRYRVAVVALEPADERSQGPLPACRDGSLLSDFQVRVLNLIAGGMTDREAARVMQVSLSRERYAVRELISRMSARTRAEAVYMAATRGLLADVSNSNPDP